jgi:hypothetical protein
LSWIILAKWIISDVFGTETEFGPVSNAIFVRLICPQESTREPLNEFSWNLRSWLIRAYLLKTSLTFYETLKFYYRVYRRTSFVTILCQINPLHTLLTSYVFKIHFNITIPSTPLSSKRSVPFMFLLTKYFISI